MAEDKTKTMLFGQAALTAIRLTDGTRANIPAGRAVPESIDPDDAERLVDEGFLVRREVVDTGDAAPTGVPAGLTAADIPAAADGDPFTAEELAELPATVDGILDAVGDNAVRARQVLDAEESKPEDKRRKTLVAGLQDVLDAAEEGES